MSWQQRGICTPEDIGAFFPSSAKRMDAEEAKSLCAMCPVITHCREYALADSGLVGIWGGLTERERSVERQERRRFAQKVAG